MATKVWVGAQQATAEVDTLTVGSSTVGHTFTVTINSKTVTYTAATGDTTTTIASTLLALLQASMEGEYTEMTSWTSLANVVTVVGPADGAPITLALSGTGTFTKATPTAPKSPHDLNDAVNWSGGLPSTGDTAVWENSDVDCLYNLAALTAVTFKPLRRASFTGRIGLPDTNAAGYREYRATYLETAGVQADIEAASGDDAGQIRLRCTAAGAVTVTVTGPGASGVPGSEPVELYGASSGFTVNVSAAGLALAPLQGQAATVATLRATDATLRGGPGLTLTTATLTNTDAQLNGGYTTLTVDRGGTVEVRGSGGGTTTTIDEGTLVWRSTGGPGTPTLGSDGVLDLSEAPGSVALAGTLTVNEGSEVRDPGGRLAAAGSFTVLLNRTDLSKVTLDFGTGRTLAVS